MAQMKNDKRNDSASHDAKTRETENCDAETPDANRDIETREAENHNTEAPDVEATRVLSPSDDSPTLAFSPEAVTDRTRALSATDSFSETESRSAEQSHSAEQDLSATRFLSASEPVTASQPVTASAVDSETEQDTEQDDATRVLSATQELTDTQSVDAEEDQDLTVALPAQDFPTQDDATGKIPVVQEISAARPLTAPRAVAPEGQDPTVALPARDFPAQDDATRAFSHRGQKPHQNQGFQQGTPQNREPLSAAQPNTAHPGTAHPPVSSPNGGYSQTGATSMTPQDNPKHPEEKTSARFPGIGVVLRHLFALLFLGASLVGAFRFFVYNGNGQMVDEQAYTEYTHQFRNYRGPTLTALDSLPIVVGVAAVLGLIAVLVWKHRFLPALVGVLCGVGACLTTQALKNYLVIKPNWGLQEALSNSAPSGHTTFAAAAGAALFLAAPRKLRPTVALLTAVTTCLTGISTIINGWHRPADVVAAILVSSIWTVLGILLLRYLRRGDFVGRARGGLVLAPLLTIATLFLSFCAVVLYAIAIFSPIPGGAFTAATCMIAAVSFGTTSLVVNLQRLGNRRYSD